MSEKTEQAVTESKSQDSRHTDHGAKSHEEHDHHQEGHQDHGHDGHKHGGHEDHHRHMAEDFKRRFWISLILTVPILAMAPLIQEFLGLGQVLSFTGDRYLLFVLSTAVFAYGGYPFLKGFVDEVRQLKPGMMTLIAVAIVVAFVYSSAVVFGLPGKTFFWELATLVVVMLLGHWIEMRSVMGASKALEGLVKLLPSEVHRVKDDGTTEDIPISELNEGETVLVKPGENLPVDGVVIKGSSSVNEAAITGESKPVSKSKDDEVIGGSVNGEGSLTVKVTGAGEDSYLYKVIDMVRQAQAGKSKSEKTADRAAQWLTFIAVGGGIITLILWLSLSGREFVFALERSVTVMVIACPHALGLAIPLVAAASTSIAARAGLLIRQRGPFEQARNVDVIMFDKTGTLTTGEFEVSEVVPLDGNESEEAILKAAAAIEAESEHSIAKAIVAAVSDTPSVSDFNSIPGKGAEGVVDGKHVKVVSPGYLKENGIEYDKSRIGELSSRGDTVVYVLMEDKLIGAIGLSDTVRSESKEAIEELNKRGVETRLITGDTEEVAARVAGELNIDQYFSGVLPDQKAEKVKEVQSQGKKVAMVGDGVNDAPALAQADLGVAIGTGTDIAAESADVILVNDDPRDVLMLLNHSQATHSKMIQNLWWATGYNAVAIPLAAGALYAWGILLNPAVGALLMSLSTVIVAFNARLLKGSEKPAKA